MRLIFRSSPSPPVAVLARRGSKKKGRQRESGRRRSLADWGFFFVTPLKKLKRHVLQFAFYLVCLVIFTCAPSS
jgi:hypothetical protein